ncbi:MAG: hypothetical protein M1420_05055 [Actinobacteria bacterium]|nr:hypothetical protein [Actinomycetota bacterium]
MKSLAEEVLDVLFYLPVGAGLAIAEEVPRLEDRGRKQVESITSNARVVGQFAVQVGSRQVRKQVRKLLPQALEGLNGVVGSIRETSPARKHQTSQSDRPGDSSDQDGVAGGPAAGDEATQAPLGHARNTARAGDRTGNTPVHRAAEPGGVRSGAVQPATVRSGTVSVDNLAIPGYDNLAASQVIRRLTNLSREELDKIHDYESHTRRRQTILNRITQLLER